MQRLHCYKEKEINMKKKIYLPFIAFSLLGFLTGCTDNQSSPSTTVVETHKHNLIETKSKEATCTEDGNITYYTCSECKKIFSDIDGTQEITLEDTVIGASGHVFEEEITDDNLVSEATCTTPAIYKKVCGECGELSDETFTYGEALGHSFVADQDNYKDLTCSDCGGHRYIYEFEEADSNGWIGEEYSDMLWKIAKTEKENTSGEFYVGRVNDNSVAESGMVGKIWLEFTALSDKDMDATLSFRGAFGAEWIYKKAFKVTVNGTEIDVGDAKIEAKYHDWNTWEIAEYSQIKLVKGYNKIRFTIMESAACDLDYAALDTETPLENHHIGYEYDATHHWHGCLDEGCDFTLDDKAEHVFDQKVMTAEYAADTPNVYYYSCVCGAKGTETFSEHKHELKQETEGLNDVMVCDCGYMERKFDLAASFSNSWSEGTEKNDQLWRNLEKRPDVLDSGNYVSHIGEAVDDKQHDDMFWIEIGVSFVGDEDIEAELILGAGINNQTSWNVMNIRVNGEKIENNNLIETNQGWDVFNEHVFGTITLKANQINKIRISPNFGCLMNWCYLKLNTSIPTINSTQTLIDEAASQVQA